MCRTQSTAVRRWAASQMSAWGVEVGVARGRADAPPVEAEEDSRRKAPTRRGPRRYLEARELTLT